MKQLQSINVFFQQLFIFEELFLSRKTPLKIPLCSCPRAEKGQLPRASSLLSELTLAHLLMHSLGLLSPDSFFGSRKMNQQCSKAIHSKQRLSLLLFMEEKGSFLGFSSLIADRETLQACKDWGAPFSSYLCGGRIALKGHSTPHARQKTRISISLSGTGKAKGAAGRAVLRAAPPRAPVAQSEGLGQKREPLMGICGLSSSGRPQHCCLRTHCSVLKRARNAPVPLAPARLPGGVGAAGERWPEISGVPPALYKRVPASLLTLSHKNSCPFRSKLTR